MISNPMQSNDEAIDPGVRRIIQTIATLQRTTQRDWLSWREVAKYQEGTEELATVLSGYASLPEAAAYFSQTANGKSVCLTPAGHAVLRLTDETPLSEPQRVANAVKAYARQVRKLRFNILGVLAIGKAQRRIVHAVQIELGDALLPNDAPTTLISKEWGTRVSGRIVSQDADEGLIYVALDSRFGAETLPAYMEVDRAFLLNQLAESIGTLTEMPPRGQAFLTMDEANMLRIAHHDSGQVADTLANLQAPWTKFLWGPPGAGKTYGLARLVSRLLSMHPGERILIVAPSNVAVDVALLQLVNRLAENGQSGLVNGRQILRYGYPRHLELLAQPELLGAQSEQALSRDIKKKSDELREAEKTNQPETTKVILRTEILEMQEELKRLVLQHVSQCQVVATTTTLAYTPNSPITQQKWTTVIVDEVTMVPPAVCLYLSSLAEKRLLLAGDPRQLGPIFEAYGGDDPEAARWMGRDVYDFSQLSTGEGEQRTVQTDDFRLVRITSQRRSSQDIWQVIRRLYPEVENLVEEARLKHIRWLEPMAGHGVVNIDVGKEVAGAQCQPHQKSWQNPKTAEYAISLAKQALGQAEQSISIAIITPYRAQYRLIKSLMKQAGLHQVVEAGTIHQFQGSEADLIIFDMVDGPGRSGIGRLFRGDTGLRLVNVAVSRAKGKFIILADRSWCQATLTRDQNTILWDLVLMTQPWDKQRLQPPPSQRAPSEDRTFIKPDDVAEASADVPVNVNAAWLWQLPVGLIYSIPNKRTKRTLNGTLAQMGLRYRHDPAKYVSIWENDEMQFYVNHIENTLSRTR